MEQGNQLLQNSADANQEIRDENLKTKQDYKGKVTENKELARGEEWYHGVTDTLASHGAYKAYSETSKRMGERGLSGLGGYSELAGEDMGNIFKKSTGIGADLAGASKTGQASEALEAGLTRANQFRSEVPGPFKMVNSAGNVAEEADTAITDTGKVADDVGSLAKPVESGAGSFVERGISNLTGAEVGSVASKGLGKALGNIGGAIDVVKDFDNIGKKGGFFGGSGTTKGDEVSNALTVAGSVLDIGSFFIPFLAPVAAAVQVAGAIDGTYQSVKDSGAKAQTAKGDYQKDIKSQIAPPSLAGVGFLATSSTDPHKLIGGSSAF